MIELLHRPDQAGVSFLDQVEEGNVLASIVLGAADHES